MSSYNKVSSNYETIKKSKKKETHKMKTIKDDDTQVQVIIKEEVTDYTTIRVTHIKGKIYNIRKRDLQGRPRNFYRKLREK